MPAALFNPQQQQAQPDPIPQPQRQQAQPVQQGGYAPPRRQSDPWATSQRGYGQPAPQPMQRRPQMQPQPQPMQRGYGAAPRGYGQPQQQRGYQPPMQYGGGRGQQMGPQRQPQNQYYGRQQQDMRPAVMPQEPSYGASLIASNPGPQGGGIYGDGFDKGPVSDYQPPSRPIYEDDQVYNKRGGY